MFENEEIIMHDLNKYSKNGFTYRIVDGVKTAIRKYILKDKFSNENLPKNINEVYTRPTKHQINTAITLHTFGKMSIRQSALCVGISDFCVRTHLKKTGSNIDSNDILADKSIHYTNVEIDEFWHYKDQRTLSDQLWTIVAIDRESGVILAYAHGDRSTDTLDMLLVELDKYSITNVYTDGWKPYVTAFSTRPVVHYVGKDGTSRVESFNNEVRQHCGRFLRKPNGVTQSLLAHDNDFKIFLYIRKYIKTFNLNIFETINQLIEQIFLKQKILIQFK